MRVNEVFSYSIGDDDAERKTQAEVLLNVYK
jgi:hypothetical protein